MIKIFVVIIISAQFLAAQEKPDYSISNNRELSGQILAEVGPVKITAGEFINNYEFGPAFIKRIQDSKKRHLEFLIYEKLLAIEGYKLKYDTLKDVRLTLKDIHDDLASEKMYRSVIWDKVTVSENEITEAAEKENTSLTLKWIYYRSQDETFEAYDKLTKGIEFDDLFAKQFNDTVAFEDRFLETNRYKLERNNPLLASIIDSLVTGRVSGPVRTHDGWYIVKLENLTREVIKTESGYFDQRYKLETALRKQKADSASDAYIRKLFFEENPVIKRPSFNSVAYYIGSKYLQPSQVKEWELEKNTAGALSIINNTLLNDTLVRMNSRAVLIKNFTEWYSTRESYLKFSLTEKSSFLNSVQEVIWRMVRDHLIISNAGKEEFYNDPEVLAEMECWKDKVVYSKLKQEIASAVSVTEEKLRDYYNSHMSDYKDERGNIKPFDEVKEKLKNDCYIYEYTRKIVNKVLTLKKSQVIKINNKLLESIAVSEEENPHSINLYSLKKGGTFARPVYPVIDYEWQFWN